MVTVCAASAKSLHTNSAYCWFGCCHGRDDPCGLGSTNNYQLISFIAVLRRESTIARKPARNAPRNPDHCIQVFAARVRNLVSLTAKSGTDVAQLLHIARIQLANIAHGPDGAAAICHC